jgi:hypothetical protein
LAWGNLAGSVAESKDFSKKRNFLKTLGSNFILKDRTLLFSTTKPFDYIVKRKEDNKWLSLSDDLRTYFKGTLEVKL